MLESKSFMFARLYQIVQSEDNQIKYPSITAKEVDNLWQKRTKKKLPSIA